MKRILTVSAGVVVVAVVLAVTVGLSVAAENEGKKLVQVSKTEHAEFAPGGTIRINDSHGDLNIEGWDRPEVEVTVAKWSKRLYTAKEMDEARKRLDRIAVTLEHKSTTELTITTAFPSRKLLRLNRGKSDLLLEYQIHVPRDSHLIVRHDQGAVMMTGVTGDVDAKVGSGDIVVMVPSADSYSIDAKTKFGGVDSDFGGAARPTRLIGRELGFAPTPVKHRMVLRVGVGNINIQDSGADSRVGAP